MGYAPEVADAVLADHFPLRPRDPFPRVGRGDVAMVVVVMIVVVMVPVYIYIVDG